MATAIGALYEVGTSLESMTSSTPRTPSQQKSAKVTHALVRTKHLHASLKCTSAKCKCHTTSTITSLEAVQREFGWSPHAVRGGSSKFGSL
jgi:hypothetical protein